MSAFTPEEIKTARGWIAEWKAEPEDKNVLDSGDFSGLLSDALDQIEQLTARIAELEAELADYREDFRRVLSDECPTDERHCGCVPILRARIAELEAERRWIPVSERLPEKNGWYPAGVRSLTTDKLNTDEAYYFVDRGWYYRGDYAGEVYCWTYPLPGLPEVTA